MLRFIKYAFSSIGLLYLTFLNSAYKLHYGEHGREYFNDDSIFFGMMLSGFLLLVHLFSIFLATVVLRKGRPEKADMFFALAFLLHLGYWIYCANSGAAMHEQ
ncbi:hypothetical protein [Hymenobacter segetis]|uniref:Uncharacterized protein n=1 Tax=Hymenobacter segetis TaxID=2025509 RepID=A0ABU9LRF5_9BACT